MTDQSPAEGLRQQLSQLVTGYRKYVQNEAGVYSYATEQKLTKKQLLDRIEQLVTAYAATVEREARIDELQNLYVDFDERKLRHIEGTRLVTIDARLAALQGPQDGDD